MKKRILSMLLVATMLLSLVPMTVFATGTTYAITNGTPESAKETNHGYITVDETAAEGETVTITVKPNEGYQLKSLTVTPAFTVTFDLNGITGTAPTSQTIKDGEKVTKPTDPTDTIHTFAGWYKTKDATTGSLSDPWDFDNDTVTANMTLYAKWTRTLGSIYGTNENVPKSDNNTAPDNAWVNDDGGKAFIAYSGKTSEVIYLYKKLEPSGAKQMSCKKTENFTKIGDDYVFSYGTQYGVFTLHMTEGKFTSVTYNGAGTDYEILSGTYAPAAPKIKYMDWDAEKKELVEKTVLEDATTEVTSTTTTLEAGKFYVVKGADVKTGTLTVNGTAANPTTLILADGAKLTATGETSNAGIKVASDKALIITTPKDGTGILEAKGGQYGAGIGGGFNGTGGNVTINGGTVNATGGSQAAGIGGGRKKAGGNITINGGIVTATGFEAIGKGDSGASSGTLTFGEGVNFKVMAGADAAGATEKTTTEYAGDHSAAYVSIESAPANKLLKSPAPKQLTSSAPAAPATITPEKQQNGTYQFKMPAANVTVTAEFEVAPTTYAITNGTPESAKETNHGYITVDETAAEGETVTITVKPNEGYQLKSLTVTPVAPTIAGALSGVFTVSDPDGIPNSGDEKKIHFSQGNLVATIDATGAPTAWKFAANQYESIGANVANTKIGKEAGDVDFFGWSTDASSNNWGIHTKIAATKNFTTGNFKDWGKAVGDGDTWRTLSKNEWSYLINTNDDENIRKGKYKYGVTVCGKTSCLILAPDDFEGTIAESYDAAAWAEAEAAGLVCLPAAGDRVGSNVLQAETYGFYWSSTKSGSEGEEAYDLRFTGSEVNPGGRREKRCIGCSVRLVTEVKAGDNSAPANEPLKSPAPAAPETITPEKQQDGTYQFKMPAANVTVTAEFEKTHTHSFTGNYIEYDTTNHKWAKKCECGEYDTANALTGVDAPTANTGLVYDNSEKTGVSEATGYTVTDGKKSAAGEYTATATLASGYIWSDGTTAAKEIKWNIAKATPYIKTNPEPTDIVYGKKLSDSTLFGGYVQVSSTNTTQVGGLFEWKLGDTIPALSDSETTEYDVTFTPADTNNYNTVSCKVKIKVTHTHNPVKVNGQAATETAAGWSDYYECKDSTDACHKYFEDATCKVEITDLNAWKAQGGKGYIAPLVHSITPVNGKNATDTEAGYKPYYECKNCGKYYEDATGLIEISNIDGWKAEGGAGYLAPLHGTDNDHDHICDYCDRNVSNHIDADNNHICDICSKTISNHIDTEPKDHICDICGKAISNHADDNKDHICDICGKAISNHIDTDPKDHVCDYCGKTISNHADDNKDHICDICGKTISNHVDTDPKDHVCDYCGKTISNHTDTNTDHICDYCGETISNHADTNKDHKCDYCGKIITNHVDEDGNKDHLCDICGDVISNHEDTNKDHVCDICGKTISNHTDADPKDHICDYCGKTINNHADEDKDHVCDYCEKAISNHEDTDKDHICEYCGKVISNHNGVLVEGTAATLESAGFKSYYKCDCGKLFEDATCKVEITDLDAWKAQGGNGYIAKLEEDPTSPQTGDTSNMTLWVMLLALSSMGLCACLVLGKKRKKEQ